MEKAFPSETCARALSSIPHVHCTQVCALSIEADRARKERRKVEHAINAGDRCSRSFAKRIARPLSRVSLIFHQARGKSCVLSSAYTSFLIASHINPVLIARITCDDRAAIFDKGKKPPSFALLSSFFFLWHGIIEPVANASNTREA